MKTLIIAEAGVNHNGSIDNAKKLIDVAHQAGADYVKFQTFKTESVVTKTAGKAEYQKNLTEENESQFEMIKKLELDAESHKILTQHCKKRGIKFLSTPFDLSSVDLLEDLNIPFYKIPSGEITNFPFLRHIGGMGKPIIMSTGMATLVEVKDALQVILDCGIEKKEITLLHCNTEYPTPMIDVNLKAMLTLGTEFGVSFGYSDHTMGIEIPIAAVAMGASVIEKHFTLDRKLSGPDHAASLEPNDLKLMITSIRNIEKALGDGLKIPSSSEKNNISIVRKSIVANNLIKAGELFSERNITVKRPGVGISPMQWNKVIGSKAKKDFEPDELIEL